MLGIVSNALRVATREESWSGRDQMRDVVTDCGVPVQDGKDCAQPAQAEARKRFWLR